MGQYYTPVLLDDKGQIVAHFNSHEYDNGLKLMEHSYVDNDFVCVVEAMLALDGARRVVWAGDYADSEDGTQDGANLFVLCQGDPVRVDCKALNSASYIPDVASNAELSVEVTTASHPYIVNVDKLEFVDKREVPVDRWGSIHPLPLLTVEGNGRGGGDYRGDWEHVGRWARDHISVSENVPEGFKKLDVAGLVG